MLSEDKVTSSFFALAHPKAQLMQERAWKYARFKAAGCTSQKQPLLPIDRELTQPSEVFPEWLELELAVGYFLAFLAYF